MRFCVTGGAGFIGSHLCRFLRESGRVLSIDDLSAPHAKPVNDGTIVHQHSDICELQPGHIQGVEWLFHLAAISSIPACQEDPMKAWRVNVLGTARVLQAAHVAGVKMVVFASSAAVYQSSRMAVSEPDPTNPRSVYAASKLAAEDIVRYYGLNTGLGTVSLRPFNVYGPGASGDSLISKAIAAARAEVTLEMFGDGSQVRDFVHVDDVVRAMMCGAARQEPGVYNVGTGIGTTVRRLASIVGCQVRSVDARQGDLLFSVANLGRVKSKLGYSPKVALADGIRRTMEALDASDGDRDVASPD